MQDLRYMQSYVWVWKTRMKGERERGREGGIEREREGERKRERGVWVPEVQGWSWITASGSFCSHIHNVLRAKQPVRKPTPEPLHDIMHRGGENPWSSTRHNAQRRSCTCVRQHALSWEDSNRLWGNCFLSFFFSFVPCFVCVTLISTVETSWAGGENDSQYCGGNKQC